MEGTYLIRLFSAFETGLRSCLKSPRKDTNPPSGDLIDAFAARQAIPDDWRDDVHTVRDYRNDLVHESDQDTEPVSLVDAQSRLSRFFSKLPVQWNG